MRFIPAPELLDSPRGRTFPGYDSHRARLRQDRPPQDCSVAVVGSGLAAMAAAIRFQHSEVRGDVAVLGSSRLLAGEFLERVEALEQAVLRSPYDHFPGLDWARDCDLLDFARFNWDALTPLERSEVRGAQAGRRAVVPLDVFKAYLAHASIVHDLPSLAWQCQVVSIDRTPQGRFLVHTTRGDITAKNIVLALGEEPTPIPPEWHSSAIRSPWDGTGDLPTGAHVGVVGSGLTAAHLVLALARKGAQVTWLQRTTETYQCSDVNAKYFRPEGRAAFRAVPEDQRLEELGRRRRPTIMWEFKPRLEALETSGQMQVVRHASAVDVSDVNGRPCVTTASGHRALVDRVYAALGTQPRRPPFGDSVAPLLSGDLPLLNEACESRNEPGVYFTGALAGMEIGPAARNIDGMRVAAGRIAAGMKLSLLTAESTKAHQ